jgi:hypothetical protein
VSWLIAVSSLHLDLLDLPCPELRALGECFTECEILSIIRSLPPDKAPGPDGFIGRFFQATCEIIRGNIMAAFDAFWLMDMRNLSSINDALLTLITKSAEAKCVKDYRPISLIHCMGRLFSKVLAMRLAPHLSSLVHGSHSTFIRGRFI